MDFEIEDKIQNERYLRCRSRLERELRERQTSPDLIHRAALAYAKFMLNDTQLDQMLDSGRANVRSGRYKLLCVYFHGALKQHLLSLNVELGTCRTKKQIQQAGKGLPNQQVFHFATEERKALPNEPKTLPKPHFPLAEAVSAERSEPCRALKHIAKLKAEAACERPSDGKAVLLEFRTMREQAMEAARRANAESREKELQKQADKSSVSYAEVCRQVEELERRKRCSETDTVNS